MFSPSINAAPAGAATRTSRRRPRPRSSESSISLPKAKRQRSALSEHTFLPPDVAPETEEVRSTKSNGSTATNGTNGTVAKRDSSRTALTPKKEIAVRSKKSKSGERAVVKGDGTVVLTTNDTYTVTRLPAWPDRLQTDKTGRQHGAVYSEFGYALALTHSHALVWPYAINSTTPETFSFTLPHPSKHATDALPLGALVSPSASATEPGLVLVMPASGKITYWESIASAATLDLIQQQRHGVELSIPGMFSAETVTQILNAESAGFVLSFSSGRLAYMSVRDAQGRPNISVQFLRGSSAGSGGGIFGSLRNALSSSSWRSDLATARAGPSTRPGERKVVTASTKGKVQAWDLHRGGHNSLLAEAEVRDAVVSALKDSDTSLTGHTIESFEILDLSFTPSPVKEEQDSVDETNLLLLISIGNRDSCHYALVRSTLRPESFDIGMIRHIRSYTAPKNPNSISKPRLHLPMPALVAFIVFDRAVVVASVAQPPPSPDSQLQAENHIQPASFEDVVDFRKDAGVEIVGTGLEEPHGAQSGVDEAKSRRHKSRHPAVLILVRGGGVIRIAATDPYKLTTNQAPQVTAKSKLEQAVFYGNQNNNPLSFQGRLEVQFTPEEIGQAALEVSQDILSSSTPHLPSLPASVDQHLRQRSAALHALATHLQTTGVALDRVTRWKLLWAAEKVKGAIAVWDKYDADLQRKEPGKKYGLLNDLVLFIHEKFKTEPVPEAGELDRIRHWFINDLYRFEIAVPWAYQAVKHTYQAGVKAHATIMQLVTEADDFVIGALGAAFKFRTENLALYGLQNETVVNGIMVSGYEDLPEFWTSTHYIAENTMKQVELARHLAQEFWPISAKEGAPDPRIVSKVRSENVDLVDLYIRSTTERYRWMHALKDPKAPRRAAELKGESLARRATMIDNLATLGLVDQAIELAEKHRVFPTLVQLVVEEMEILRQKWENIDTRAITESSDAQGDQDRASHLEQLVETYFERFGAPFADALYDYYVKRGELYALISENEGREEYLTKFLRRSDAYAKVAWVNEISKEKNFSRAAEVLLNYGLQRENDLWSKKVELSIGKLARLASGKHSEASGLIVPDGGKADLLPANKQLSLIQIQEKIYLHVQPTIKAAIDENAELQLAIEAYGISANQERDAAQALLTERLTALLAHKAMGAMELIDLLTLMGSERGSDQPGFLDGQEFYYALLALQSGPDDKDEVRETETMIWRRCMVRDDWQEINNTDLKIDAEVSQKVKSTALFTTLRACVKNRLFEKSSIFTPLTPEHIRGSGIGDLDSRFDNTDPSVRDALVRDLQRDDTQLKTYIEKSRLQKWFESALDAAKVSIQEEANEVTEGSAVMNEVAEELARMEGKIGFESREKALTALRGKPRLRSGFKTSMVIGGGGAYRKSITVGERH